MVYWDGDAFAASVEQAADRRLRRRPLVVVVRDGGVISSVSREAYGLGVRKGMAERRARLLCRELTCLPPSYDLYEQFEDSIWELCESVTPALGRAGLARGWMNLGGVRDPVKQALWFSREASSWLKVTLSQGMGANRTVAQLAAAVRRPTGFTRVVAGQEAAFVGLLPLERLPGIGDDALQRMRDLGWRQLRHLAELPAEVLVRLFGRDALNWQQVARGEDSPETFKVDQEEKGLERECWCPEWVEDDRVVEDLLYGLCEELAAALRSLRR